MAEPADPEKRIETCNLCGERNVEIIECDDLPEDLEGSACKSCCEFHTEEAESGRRKEEGQRQDRIDDAMFDLIDD